MIRQRYICHRGGPKLSEYVQLAATFSSSGAGYRDKERYDCK